MERVTAFLERKLKLRVNREKSAVDRPSRRKFLGFRLYRHGGRVRIGLAPKTLKRVRLPTPAKAPGVPPAAP